MLSVKELRSLASSLRAKEFKKQLGPFALIQRPPKDKAPNLPEPAQTSMANADLVATGILTLLFEFEELSVATLPPLAETDELSVGRLPDCDLILEHSSVSKRHATLKWDRKNARASVADVGSTNGTFLNGSTIAARETILRDGDILSFGEVQFWFLLTDTLHEKIGAGTGRPAKKKGLFD